MVWLPRRQNRTLCGGEIPLKQFMATVAKASSDLESLCEQQLAATGMTEPRRY
jgi:hypothetical protein